MLRMLVAALVVAGAACAESAKAPPAPARNPYAGTSWKLAEAGRDAPTIDFDQSRAGGGTGCNRWFAQVTGEEPALRFSAIGTTRRMCAGEQMNIEREFLATLRAAETARIEDGALVLSDGGGAELARFERVP